MRKREESMKSEKSKTAKKEQSLDSDQRNSEEWKGSNPKQDWDSCIKEKEKKRKKRGRKEERILLSPFSMLLLLFTFLVFYR